MKKTLATCLALLLLLTGCGGSGTQTTTAPADGPVTFTMAATMKRYDGSALMSAVHIDEEFTEATGYVRKTMNFIYNTRLVWGDLEEGGVPTLYQIPYEDARVMLRNNGSRNIQALLDERGWGDELWNETLLAPLRDENGDLHGIPASIATTALLCNERLFREAGLVDADGQVRYPTTWEEVTEAAGAIKEKTGKIGLNMSCNDMYGSKVFISIAESYGAEVVRTDENGTVIPQLNHPGVVKAMEWYRELVEKIYINSNAFMNDAANCIQSVALGESGMCFCEGELPTDLQADRSFNLDELAVVPMPKGTHETKQLATGYCYWFNRDATDDQVRAALEYIERYGASPIWNEEQHQRVLDHAEREIREYGRYFPQPRVFSQSYLTEYAKAVAENEESVDGVYLPHLQESLKPERLKLEVSDELDLYRFLLTGIQELCLKPEMDIAGYMDQMNQDYQKVLDLAAGIE